MVVALVLAGIAGGTIGLAFAITWAINKTLALIHRLRHR